MARLASNWLETNFSLSRPIKVLDRDLANGYLLLQVAQQCDLLAPVELQNAVDDHNPQSATTNFLLLSKAIHAAGIDLSNKDISEIISEQPGAAAKLVVQLKKYKESKTRRKLLSPINPVKSSSKMKSVRNKQQDFEASLDPNSRYLASSEARRLLESKNNNALHFEANLMKFKTFRLQTEEDMRKERALEALQAIARRDARRNELLSMSQEVADRHRMVTQRLIQDWDATQAVKRGRQVRDLQYELAVSRRRELLREKLMRCNEDDLRRSVNAFEDQYRVQLGITANDDFETDIPDLLPPAQNSAVTLEQDKRILLSPWPGEEPGKSFFQRLEQTLTDSSDSISNSSVDYLKQVKQRVAAHRQAKEAADRSLRTQSVAVIPVELVSDNKTPVDDTADPDSDDEIAQRVTQDFEAYKVSLQRIMDAAELQLEEFSQECRDKEVSSGERAASMLGVTEVNILRQQNKHEQATVMCTDLVIELLDDILAHSSSTSIDDLGRANVAVIAFEYDYEPNRLQRRLKKLFTEYMFAVRRSLSDYLQLDIDLSPADLKELNQLYQLDIWPAYVALARNIGHWKYEATNSFDYVSSIIETIRITFEQTLVHIAPCIQPHSSSSIVCPFRPLSVTKFELMNLDSKFKISVLPTLLTTSMAPFAAARTRHRIVSLSFKSTHHSSHVNMQSILSSVTQWAADTVLLWDPLTALNCGLMLKKLHEKLSVPPQQSKAASPSAATVNNLFTFSDILPILVERRVFEPLLTALANCDQNSVTNLNSMLPLSSQAIRVLADIIDITGRILAANALLSNPVTPAASKKKPLVRASLPFSAHSLPVLLGEVLWIRVYLLDRLFIHLASHAPQQFKDMQFSVESLPVVLVVSQPLAVLNSLSQPVDSDEPSYVRVLDWFLRGNRRDNIPKDDVELLQAVDSEAGSGKIAFKKAKGKTQQEEFVHETSLLSTAVQLDFRTIKPDQKVIDGDGFSDSQALSEGVDPDLHVCEHVLSIFYGLPRIETAVPVVKASSKTSALATPPSKALLKSSGSSSLPIEEESLIGSSYDSLTICYDDDLSSTRFPVKIENSCVVEVSRPLLLAEFLLTICLDALEYSTDIASEFVDSAIDSYNIESPPSDLDNSITQAIVNELKLLPVQGVCERAQSIRHFRRSKLLQGADLLAFQHLTGHRPLLLTPDLDQYQVAESVSLFKLHRQIISSSAHIDNLLAMQIQQLVLLQRSLHDTEISQQERLTSGSSVDNAIFNGICNRTCSHIEQLLSRGVSKQSLSSGHSVKTIIDELACVLGNSLDVAHLDLLTQLERVATTVQHAVTEFLDQVRQMLQNSASALLYAVQRQLDLGRKVCLLLLRAGYTTAQESFPLTCRSDASTMNSVTQRQTLLKAVLYEVSCYLQLGKDSIIEDEWISLYSISEVMLTLNESDITVEHGLASSVMCNIYCDAMDVCLGLLQGILLALGNARQSEIGFNSLVSSLMHQRHNQQHASLKLWVQNLKDKFAVVAQPFAADEDLSSFLTVLSNNTYSYIEAPVVEVTALRSSILCSSTTALDLQTVSVLAVQVLSVPRLFQAVSEQRHCVTSLSLDSFGNASLPVTAASQLSIVDIATSVLVNHLAPQSQSVSAQGNSKIQPVSPFRSVIDRSIQSAVTKTSSFTYTPTVDRIPAPWNDEGFIRALVIESVTRLDVISHIDITQVSLNDDNECTLNAIADDDDSQVVRILYSVLADVMSETIRFTFRNSKSSLLIGSQCTMPWPVIHQLASLFQPVKIDLQVPINDFFDAVFASPALNTLIQAWNPRQDSLTLQDDMKALLRTLALICFRPQLESVDLQKLLIFCSSLWHCRHRPIEYPMLFTEFVQLDSTALNLPQFLDFGFCRLLKLISLTQPEADVPKNSLRSDWVSGDSISRSQLLLFEDKLPQNSAMRTSLERLSAGFPESVCLTLHHSSAASDALVWITADEADKVSCSDILDVCMRSCRG